MNKKSLFLSLIFSLFISNNSFANQPSKTGKTDLIVNNGFANIVERLAPTVVNISTTKKDKNNVNQLLTKLPEDQVFDRLKNLLQKHSLKQKKSVSLGSGFIISKDGYIATKYHVIDDAEEITVNLNDGRKFKAKIIGFDQKTDTAVLKINTKKDLPFVKFGKAKDSRIGDWVIVIGNPFGLGGSVSAGIVSAKGRDVIFGQGDFIQTDAAINRGNSGGPIFNSKGEVIGVATAIFSTSGGSIGIGFAITSETALPIINQLKEKGSITRGWVGVTLQEVDEKIAQAVAMPKPKGALVVATIKDSPARKAGILPGDVIIEFDGKEIDKMKILPQIASSTAVGKKVRVVALRQGKKKKFKLIVKKLPDNLDVVKEEKIKPQAQIIGIGLLDLTEKNREKLNIKDKKGILVAEVKIGSKAAEVGILPGDIIISANQSQINSIKDFQKTILDAIEADKNLVLLVLKRSEKYLSVVIEM